MDHTCDLPKTVCQAAQAKNCLLHANHDRFTGASMVMPQRYMSLCLHCIVHRGADPKALQLQQLAVPPIAPLHGPAETTQLAVSQALCSIEHFVPVHSEGEKICPFVSLMGHLIQQGLEQPHISVPSSPNPDCLIHKPS